MSTTRRALSGVTRTKRALAKAPGWSPRRDSRRALTRCRSAVLIVGAPDRLFAEGAKREERRIEWGNSSATPLAVFLDVPAVGAGGRELAQLVPDHRVGDEHRHVLAAVVHREGVADHR